MVTRRVCKALTYLAQYKKPCLVEDQIYGGKTKKILHMYHKEWWGIRSATECLPGWRLMINADGENDLKKIEQEIRRVNPTVIFFHGYSYNAADISEYLRKIFKKNIYIDIVTHVSVAQFDNQFEIDMISIMYQQKQSGVIDKLWSVKPGFSYTCSQFEKLLLVNTAPAWEGQVQEREISAAMLPLTRGLRKNMQANHIAFVQSSYDVIFSSLERVDLSGIIDERKIVKIGHIPQKNTREIMRSVGLVSNVTLIECQPMVFNESISVGTPCLTGPLYLPFCYDHPLRKITEIREPDNVKLIIERAETIKDYWLSDSKYMISLCKDFHNKVVSLSAETYAQSVEGRI